MGSARDYLAGRSGVMELQESNFTHVCMAVLQKAGLSLSNTLKALTPSPAEMRKQTRRKLDLNEIRVRQRKLGELRWLAMVSLPDSNARQAALAATVNHLQVYDVSRINDLIRAGQSCFHVQLGFGCAERVCGGLR